MPRRRQKNKIHVGELILARSEGELWPAQVIKTGSRRLTVRFFDQGKSTGHIHEASVVALHKDDEIQSDNPLVQAAMHAAKAVLTGDWGCRWRVARARGKAGLIRSEDVEMSDSDEDPDTDAMEDEGAAAAVPVHERMVNLGPIPAPMSLELNNEEVAAEPALNTATCSKAPSVRREHVHTRGASPIHEDQEERVVAASWLQQTCSSIVRGLSSFINHK